MITWQAGKAGYENLWRTCALSTAHASKALAIAKLLNTPTYRDQYTQVALQTNTPWWMIAAIHERESSARFDTQLWQGDPLNQVSTHEPKGKGPYKSWTACAVDAILAHKSAQDVIDTPAKAAWFCELYNGWGYTSRGENTPYVWAWTNHEQRGKFVRDHQYDPNETDAQPGCAAIWRALQTIGVKMADDTPTEEKPMSPPVAVQVPHEQQLEDMLSKIRQVAGFTNMLTPVIPARWRPLYQIAPLLIEDVARWIEAARNQNTSAADVSALINLTATHAGSVVTAIKPPAAT